MHHLVPVVVAGDRRDRCDRLRCRVEQPQAVRVDRLAGEHDSRRGERQRGQLVRVLDDRFLAVLVRDANGPVSVKVGVVEAVRRYQLRRDRQPAAGGIRVGALTNTEALG